MKKKKMFKMKMSRNESQFEYLSQQKVDIDSFLLMVMKFVGKIELV